MKISVKLVMALLLAFAAASVVHAGVIIDDDFNDGALGTNTLGTGTGFVSVSQNSANTSVAEAGTDVTMTSNLGTLLQIYGKDAFTLTTPQTITMDFTNLDFDSVGGTKVVRLGLSTNSTDNWFYGAAGKLSFSTTPIGSDIDITSGLTGGDTTLVFNFTSTTYEVKQGATTLASGSHTYTGDAYVTVSIQDATTNSVVVDRIVVGDPLPIPEPGTLALFAAAMVGLLCYAWRKRK